MKHKIIIFLLIIAIIGLMIFGGYIFLSKNSQNFENFEEITSDSNIFTQGLVYDDGYFLISSGAPEYFPEVETWLGILSLDGLFESKFTLDKKTFFGEGITHLDGKIYFVTWKNQRGFILDDTNFQKIREFSYPNAEWWGLTDDGKQIFMSDGTNVITIFDRNFNKISEISVTKNGVPVTKINELEYINGSIFANIWLTNDIIEIDAKTGEIKNCWNFDFLKNHEHAKNAIAAEMNGIAFDWKNRKIFLTGKLWRTIYAFDASDFGK